MSRNRPSAAFRRPSGAEEGEAACRGRRGGGSASPTNKEAQGLSNSCSGSERGGQPPQVGGHALRLALAGGGTGGHIVPGLHLLAAVREARRGPADLLWFVSGREVERRVLAGRGLAELALERVALRVEPPGGGAPSRAGLCARTPRAVLAVRAALKRHRSQVLLGLGGFTSLPAVLAARSLRIPVALLEINARAGAATRWLGPLASRVLHAWRATLPAASDERHVHVGPPLAPEFARGAPDAEARAAACARLGFDPARPLLLVLGGSQGSQALNGFVAAQAGALAASGLQILHQTGPGRLAEGRSDLSGCRALEYVSDVHGALSAATLVLCRGGASTLAEVAALRVPALVAPYPHHADRHQEGNARELGAGARLVPDARLDAGLRSEIVRLCSDAGASEREAMAAALALALPLDAAARIWNELVALARGLSTGLSTDCGEDARSASEEQHGRET